MFQKSGPSGASLALALALVGACSFAAGRARAEGDADRTSLQPELTVEQQWNSNIFSARHDEKDSLVTIFRPSLSFRNEGELGYVRLNGWVSNHLYWDESDLNGADRGGRLLFDRKLAPRFDLFGDASTVRFADRDEIRSDPTGASQEGVIVSGGSPDVDIDQATMGGRYHLSPRTDMELSGGLNRIDYNRHPLGATTYRDRSGWYTSWSLAHQLTPLDRLQFALVASVTDQDSVTAAIAQQSQGLGLPPSSVPLNTGESRSEQQSATLGWERAWSPRWLTSLSVGVRRLDSHVSDASRAASTPVTAVVDDGSGPVFAYAPTSTFIPVDFDDTGPAMVGTVMLQRTFSRGVLRLSYSRETQVASGALSSDVDVDSFGLSYTHKLAQRVKFGFDGSFDYYTSANDAPRLVGAYFTPVPVSDWDPNTGASYTCGGPFGPGGKLIVTGKAPFNFGQCEVGTSSELNGQRLLLTARIDWQMRKRLGSFIVIRYYDQKADPGLWGTDYNKYTLGVGFRYAWDLEL